MAIEKLPTSVLVLGIAAIVFIAVLIFLLLNKLLKKGIQLGAGDKKLIVGDIEKNVDDKLELFKTDIEKKEKDRLHDEEYRKKLFRQSGEIDEKTKADERRVIRRINGTIKEIFLPFVKCEMPMLSCVELVKDVLQERVDYNCMRERLTATERKGYIADILYFIEQDYKAFLHKLPAVPCGTEQYPAWKEIAPQIETIVNEWADEMVKIIARRIKEKIAMYKAEQSAFLLPEYKEICIDYPIKKNIGYLKALGIEQEMYV